MNVRDLHKYATYQTMLHLLGNKRDLSGLIANNTSAYVDTVKVGDEIQHNIVIRHFTTNIVMMYANGSVLIDCKGYRSKTTKERVNAFLPSRFRIFQKSFVWYVWDRVNDTEMLFHDGMTFYPDGFVIWSGAECAKRGNTCHA